MKRIVEKVVAFEIVCITCLVVLLQPLICFGETNVAARAMPVNGEQRVESSVVVKAGDRVALSFILKDAEGAVVTETKKPISVVVGAGKLVPGLEAYLLGKSKGHQGIAHITPEQGYGPLKEGMEVVIDRDSLGVELLRVGMFVDVQSERDGKLVKGRVAALNGDKATIDFNHPMAGRELVYEVTVLDIKRLS